MEGYDGGKSGEFLVVWGVGSSIGEYGRVEKCRGRIEESEGRCGVSGRVYGVNVESVGKRVGVWRGVEKCVGKCGESPHTFVHLPHTSLHTHSTLLPHTLTFT